MPGKATPADALKLSKELQQVLAAVNKETEEPDLFKKTRVKNDLNMEAGMSIRDWTATRKII